ncbi:MAG: binding-protein-dependent transporter inner rane component [Nocardioides sp.]|nr:binding-protein-dependent transporter inner rane component [Nocardioides sp.]
MIGVNRAVVLRTTTGVRHAAGRAASRKWLARVAVWCALVVLWQVVADSLGPALFPGLESVGTEGVSQVFRLGYQMTLLESLGQLLLGFLIACVVAIPLGAMMGASRVWNDLLQPYAYGLYVTPREALVPLLIIVLGTELQFRIVIVILFSAFFPMVNAAKGVAEVVHGPLAEMSRSICTSRWRFFASILLPGSLPYLIAGIRLGLGMAFNGIVIAEIWTSTGVGGALNSLASYRQLPAYFALTGMVAVIAIASYSALGVVEARFRVRYGMSDGKG